MYCPKGQVHANLATTKSYIEQAASQEVGIIVFPEMSITGYINEENYPDALLQLDSPEVDEFVGMTTDNTIMAVAGIAERNPDGPPFITQLVAHKGELLGYYRKVNIAKDEKGLHAAGSDINTFRHPLADFGVAVCADIDKEEIFAEYAKQGADIVFETAAPGLYGSQEERNWQSGFEWWRNKCENQLGSYAGKYKLPIAVATQAGRTIDEDFPGGGYVFNEKGELTYATPDWREGVLYAEVTLESG